MAKQTITETGDQTVFGIHGGLHFLSVAGTFGGTAITLKYRRDVDSSFVTIQDISITANKNQTVYLPGGELKAFATGGSGRDLHSCAADLFAGGTGVHILGQGGHRFRGIQRLRVARSLGIGEPLGCCGLCIHEPRIQIIFELVLE